MRIASTFVLLFVAACDFHTVDTGSPDGGGVVGPGQAQLTVTTHGPNGAGSIASGDQTIDCALGGSSRCTAVYPAGTSVTLTANPTLGYLAAAMWPSCPTTSATCTFTLAQSTTVDATFMPASFPLVVMMSSDGTVTSNDGNITCGSSCAHPYLFGSTVMLTAHPNNSFQFDHWVGGPCDRSTQSTCTITMQAAPVTTSASFQGD